MTLEKSLLAILFVLGFAAPVASFAQPAAPSGAKIVFRICRAPGADISMTDRAIEIPAGTEYDESRPAPRDLPAQPAATRRPALAVVTTRSAALPAKGFCVTAPVKLRGVVDRAAIRPSIGAMFEPSGNWRNAAALGISLTYGYWQSQGD